MEKIRSTLLLTFDYELFLGRSGHVRQCLIEPTSRILKILSKYNATATFFVDALYLLRLKDVNKADYDVVEKQLKMIVAQGSRIELHIHPHWYDAVYDGVTNEFVLSNVSRYKHSSCQKMVLATMFRDSVFLLNSIARSVDASYSVQAFRAGGWCLDPFTDIKSYMVEYGINIDSSVLPGMSCEISHQSYDYTDISQDVPYRFEDDEHISKEKGAFLEVPVSMYKYRPYQKVMHFIKGKILKKTYTYQGDGKMSYNMKRKSLKEGIDYLLKTTIVPFSIDGFCHIPSRSELRKKSIWTLVGHPKTLTEYSFYALEYLCKNMYSVSAISDKILIDE